MAGLRDEEDDLREECAALRAEVERLQRILDSRPAINAGLPESYIRWSQSIYVMEFTHATKETRQ